MSRKHRAVLLFAAAAFVFAAALVAGGSLHMPDIAHAVVDGAGLVAANFVVIGAGDLRAMRQGLTDLKRDGAAKLAEYNALAAKATMTAEETARCAALDAELNAIEANAATQASAIEEEERRARRSAAFAVPPVPVAQPHRRPALAITSNEPDPVAMGGFRSLAELATCVRTAHFGVADPRLAALPTSTMQNGDASGVGFELPPAMRQDIWELVFDGSDMLSFVQPEPTSASAVMVPTDETTPWGAAGVRAFWRQKGGQLRASAPSSSAELVAVHPLDAFVVADDILLNDARRLADRLTRRAAQAIRWTASESIFWGDGVGQPMGFMRSASRIAVAKEAGQAAATIVLPNVLKMAARILRGGAPLVWAGNSEILPQVQQLMIGQVPLWLGNNQGVQSEFVEGSINGRPLNIFEHCEALGTEGDIALFNPAGYYACTSANGTIDSQASIHLYFDYAATAFRWTFRMGGQPLLKKPVQPARGTATKAHFVTLATRA